MTDNNSDFSQHSYRDYLDKEGFREIMTVIIQKQMELIGFRLALTKARNINDLSVNDHGRVVSYYGDPQEIITKLLDQYGQLTGEAAYYFSKKAVDQLLKTHHNLNMPLILQQYNPTTEFSRDLTGMH